MAERQGIKERNIYRERENEKERNCMHEKDSTQKIGFISRNCISCQTEKLLENIKQGFCTKSRFTF